MFAWTSLVHRRPVWKQWHKIILQAKRLERDFLIGENALSKCTYLGGDADILPLDHPLLDLPADSRPHPSLVTVEPGRVYEAVAEVQGEPDSRLHVGVGGLRAETK